MRQKNLIFFMCIVWIAVNYCLCTSGILAGSGVDGDHIAGVYEQRDIDGCTGLNGTGLCSVGSCVALNTRLAVRNLKSYLDRRLAGEDRTLFHWDLLL